MRKYLNLRTNIALGLIFAFLVNTLGPIPTAQAGEMVMPVMPMPGTMVHLSSAYIPAHLQGITIHPDNALKFDFLIHKGDGNLSQEQKKQEYTKLVKYFLASLTVPDKDQWVNLSPYEKDRIIEGNFGKTEMGRDLLSQDYLLKQITSSLMYPESGLGKSFWDTVYARAWQEYHTTNVPVNTFNKVWIVPDEAVVYESGNTAYILKSHLKVMLEEDYLSLSHSVIARSGATKQSLIKGLVRTSLLSRVEMIKLFFQADKNISLRKSKSQRPKDKDLGGIDMNSANLNLKIRRDGKGMALPLMSQQDLTQLSNIDGFVPVIIAINSVINLPILNELQQKIQ